MRSARGHSARGDDPECSSEDERDKKQEDKKWEQQNGSGKQEGKESREKQEQTEGRKRELITTVPKLPQPLLRNPGNVRRQPVAEFAKEE